MKILGNDGKYYATVKEAKEADERFEEEQKALEAKKDAEIKSVSNQKKELSNKIEDATKKYEAAQEKYEKLKKEAERFKIKWHVQQIMFVKPKRQIYHYI